VDGHDVGRAGEARDRCNVAEKKEIELVVERGVDRSRCAELEQRIAVRRCANGGLCGDIGAGPRPVLDDEWPAEPFRQPLSPQPRENVAAATGGGGSRLSPRTARVG
jgi:hypothetical protein